MNLCFYTPTPLAAQGLIKFGRMHGSHRKIAAEVIFHYTVRFRITLRVEVSLSCLPVCSACFLHPIGLYFGDSLMKFGTLALFDPSMNTIENGLDRSTF